MKNSVGRIGCMLLVVIMVASIMVGCTTSSEKTNTNSSTTASSEKTTTDSSTTEASAELSGKISVLGWSSGGEITEVKKEITQLFMEKYPNVSVEDSWIPGDQIDEKMDSALAAGTAQDVLILSPDWYGVRAKFFEDLRPYMKKSGLNPEIYIPEIWKACLLATGNTGKVEGLPFLANPAVVIYNKDLFDKAGVAYPTADWTWDDYHDIAAKLTSGTGVNKVYGSCNNQFKNVLWAMYGGSMFNEDMTASNVTDPKVVKGVQWYANMILEGIIPDAATSKAMDAASMFVSQKAALYFTHPQVLQTLGEMVGDNFRWDIISPPVDPDNKGVNALWIESLAVNKASKVKDLAYAYVEFFSTNEEAAKKICALGSPAIQSVAKDYYVKMTYPNSNVSKKIMYDSMLGAELNKVGGGLGEHTKMINTLYEYINQNPSADMAALMEEYEPKLTDALKSVFGDRKYD
jgi:multiple sugar transport system substrate-binding protein